MNPNELIQKIREDLEDQDLKIIFDRLKESLKSDTDRYKAFVLHKNRFNRTTNDWTNGLVSYGDYQVEVNRLIRNLMEFIPKIKAEDIKDQVDETVDLSVGPISDPILVFCFDEQDQLDLQAFFKLLRFEKAEVLMHTGGSDIKNHDLIVFDNHHLPDARDRNLDEAQNQAIQERSELMKSYLGAETHPLLIHLGEFLPLVSQHRDRIHAANSKFTLYSRIKEILDFRRRFLSQ